GPAGTHIGAPRRRRSPCGTATKSISSRTSDSLAVFLMSMGIPSNSLPRSGRPEGTAGRRGLSRSPSNYPSHDGGGTGRWEMIRSEAEYREARKRLDEDRLFIQAQQKALEAEG